MRGNPKWCLKRTEINMSTETTATETKVETIATQPKTETTSTQVSPEVDYETELARKDAELLQIRKEKDNYKKAYLKEAGALPDEENDTPPADWKEQARRIAREEYLSTKEAELQSQKDALVTASAKKIKELTLALRNRSQVTSTSGQGSNEDKPEVKIEYFSSEQIAALKARGFDDKKLEELKKNMAKVKSA